MMQFPIKRIYDIIEKSESGDISAEQATALALRAIAQIEFNKLVQREMGRKNKEESEGNIPSLRRRMVGKKT